MDNQGKPKDDNQFDASLPLPVDHTAKGEKSAHDGKAAGTDAAVNLIRKKIESVYEREPSAAAEAKDIAHLAPEKPLSRHQKFIMELTSSGKPLDEVQTAWHDYYAGLPEADKLEVWQEFYSAHSASSQYKTGSAASHKESSTNTVSAEETSAIRHASGTHQRKAKTRKLMTPPKTYPQKLLRHQTSPSPIRSMVFGLGIGCIAILIFLFSFFNERFIAPFIQPSRNVSNTQIITAGAVAGSSPQIIIPKINVQIPVVYDVNTIDENSVELALERGVVHYADTAVPGQDGNVVIVGHSSNNIFNPGKYKFAFVLLSRLATGDTFYLDLGGKRYTYEVYKKDTVSPTDVSVLGPQDKAATATLVTCDPPGTSTNRLVVVGQQIDPSPTANAAASADNGILATKSSIIPGNSPSLWSRFWHWLSS